MKKTLFAAAASVALMGQASPPAAAPAQVKLWRLDCGTMDWPDFAAFSDAHRYDGKAYKLVDSCYLVQHGDDYLLWDTGLSGELAGKSQDEDGITIALKERIVPQLARIGVTPSQVRYVGISHYHNDHTGQAADFPGATLLIGTQDLEVLRNPDKRIEGDPIKPWRGADAKVQPVARDHDVFGDGSVTMLAMPGHTPGHHSLLVRLKDKGPVLLSGDQFHATESYAHDAVPVFNTDRADTLASIHRFKAIVANLKATVIIQHEPADVAELPAFPKPAT